MHRRTEIIKEIYHLTEHVEGGSFSEVYTSSNEAGGRPFAGSIYFLLDAGEISHFHEIDCDEIWYYHEGCGMRITVLANESRKEYLLGKEVEKNEQSMVVIPRGSIFAAENLKDDGFTFVSCVTVPQFTYEGFRLVYEDEIRERYPDISEEILYLAYKSQENLAEGAY